MTLAERIQALIDAADHEGWPQQLQHQHNVLLVDGNQAYLWYLTPSGVVYAVDQDRFAQEFELEEDPATVRRVYQAAMDRWPELGELGS